MKALLVLTLFAITGQEQNNIISIPKPMLNQCFTEHQVIDPTLKWPIVKEEQLGDEKRTRFTLKSDTKSDNIFMARVELVPGTKDVSGISYAHVILSQEKVLQEVVFLRKSKDCFKLSLFFNNENE